MESLQFQLQEVEKRRNDLMPEHQRVQKRSQKIQSIQDKRTICIKRAWRRKIKEEIDWKEERFRLSDKVDKNRMTDAEMETELQGLQAGEERRGSNASQTGDGCLEAFWQQFIALGANGIVTFVQRSEQHKGRCEEKKDEGMVKMNKSKAESVSSWCYQRQAGSMKAHQREVWRLIFIVFGVYLVNAEVQEGQAKEVHPDRQDGLLGKRKG